MAEWLYEDGIGEARAILVEDGAIVEALIELPGTLRAGTVASGRLTAILVPGRRAIVTLDGGGEALVEPLPGALTEGARVTVEIVREAIPEAGRAKLPKARFTEAVACEAPTLRDRLGDVVAVPSTGPDLFERAGWSELLEQAVSGEIAFEGGALRMSITPAMTLFDVDGALPPPALAVAGARAVGQAIRRFDIGGSIGIDLPTLPAREGRLAAAAALDAALPQPFERTAVNGFGFLQIVRRRVRASLPELLQADPAGAAARALLRLAERTPGTGVRELIAAPAVIACIAAQPDWIAALERRIGAPAVLREAPGLAIAAGHVHAAFR
ncbi:MAG: ribonuclease [Pseudomonadota bacterium]|nr:ribonuclease [Pseudomonadota bacterium]